jgi:hypothetical protein
MAYVNYQSVPLRASAATTPAATSGQDASVTLPETVSSVWVSVIKTAEANADNLLTVRLQAYTNGAVWIDVPCDIVQYTTGAVTTANDGVTVTARAPNIIDRSTFSTLIAIAHFPELPSNIVRSIWIASGTAVSHTFAVMAHFRENEQ